MVRHVSAAQANREFSKLLRAAQNGERVVVTSRGKPVAEISPVKDSEAERREAQKKLMERLKSQPIMNFPRLTRDDFYD